MLFRSEMAAFAVKAQDNKDVAAKSFAAAAKLYEEATSKADQFKWSYQRRELEARRARHRLQAMPTTRPAPRLSSRNWKK